MPIDPKTIEHHFRNLSFSPDRRAAFEVSALAGRLQTLRDRAAALQAMDGAAAFPAGMLDDLCARHVRATEAYWSAEGRCASSMITGPANFPVERNRRRMATADKRSAEVTAHLAAATRRLERVAFPHGMGDAIRAADPDALDKLRAKLADKREWHQQAKTANAILRKHGAAALPHLQAAGLRADVIKRAMWLDHNGRPWGFTTSNSSAEIRRLEARIGQLERMQARGTVETEAAGVRVVENAEAARLQLIFPGKPDPETIGRLKANGFRWSPREGAWQRHLNNAGRWAAERVLQAA